MKKIFVYPLNIIYYLFFGFFLTFFHLVQVISFNLGGYNAQKKSVDYLNYVLLRCLNLLGNLVVFHKSSDVPEHVPIIFVANHQSTYDIPPLFWYLRQYHPKFISKIELSKGIPSISYNLRNGGHLLIERSDSEGSLKKIEEFACLIDEKCWSVVIFPEGTRSRDGKLKRFHKRGLLTLFKVLKRAHVVPISISNSWKLARYKYFPIPLGIKVFIKMHKPFAVADFSENELVDKVQEKIHLGVEIPRN